MAEYTVSFAAVGFADIDLVGGKGANLGAHVLASDSHRAHQPFARVEAPLT